jgi:hypothetical protein
MPYYVFKVMPFAQLERLAEFEVYADASARAKSLRGELAAGSPARIKVMFAADLQAAEDLLLQVREAGPAGDE